ncbi:MAG: hypothetical protein JO257_17675 [Deltaproteobacteria bacterium]|nr:hypothetical protein [Deltaproteobacteria bacterium]
MRAIALALLVGACGANDKPALANAPRPDPAAVAGVAAAAAAAVTLANPNATQTPEKRDQFENKQPTEVKEHVTGDVLDRLDQTGSGSGSAHEATLKTAPAKKPKGKPAKIPSPQDAAAAVGPANDQPDALPAR